jgi:chromosome partitioning protein
LHQSDTPIREIRHNAESMGLARVIAVANLKGGTGKTTCSVNLAGSLAERGRKVLLVDFDPQASATVWVHETDDGSALVEGLRRRDLRGCEVATRAGFDLIPSGTALAVSGAAMLSGEPLPMALAESLEQLARAYDFVLIDCPPSAGALAYNALAASSGVLSPVEASQVALVGMAQFEGLVSQLRRIAPRLEIVGVQPARVGRTAHAREVVAVLEERYGELVYPAIPDTVVLKDAAANGQTIGQYDPRHKVSEIFRQTAERLEIESNGK